MTLAIEPMVNVGGPATKTLDDGWTVVTADGSLSAHFEHTVAITPDGMRDPDPAGGPMNSRKLARSTREDASAILGGRSGLDTRLQRRARERD